MLWYIVVRLLGLREKISDPLSEHFIWQFITCTQINNFSVSHGNENKKRKIPPFDLFLLSYYKTMFTIYFLYSCRCFYKNWPLGKSCVPEATKEGCLYFAYRNYNFFCLLKILRQSITPVIVSEYPLKLNFSRYRIKKQFLPVLMLVPR